MTWWSVQPAVEREFEELIQVARDAAEANPAGGSLELDPNVVIPREVTDLDVHHMPGCFHTEYAEDDVAQGAVYHYGTQVFYGGFGKDVKPKGDVAASIANYLKLAKPDFKPQWILDLGCTAGANTFPYKEVFPEAEVHGIDVGAPMLRFGHAWAEAEGIPMHYHQRNAETPGFPDNHFDIITSSFFFSRAIGAGDEEGAERVLPDAKAWRDHAAHGAAANEPRIPITTSCWIGTASTTTSRTPKNSAISTF